MFKGGLGHKRTSEKWDCSCELCLVLTLAETPAWQIYKVGESFAPDVSVAQMTDFDDVHHFKGSPDEAASSSQYKM